MLGVGRAHGLFFTAVGSGGQKLVDRSGSGPDWSNYSNAAAQASPY